MQEPSEAAFLAATALCRAATAQLSDAVGGALASGLVQTTMISLRVERQPEGLSVRGRRRTARGTRAIGTQVVMAGVHMVALDVYTGIGLARSGVVVDVGGGVFEFCSPKALALRRTDSELNAYLVQGQEWIDASPRRHDALLPQANQ